MEVDAEHQERVRKQFGETAADYVASPSHAHGDDLDKLSSWAESGEDKRLLDVATGGGHTALKLAPLYGTVVASDLTSTMLHAAEQFIRGAGASNVDFAVADAESLAFDTSYFDAVSCRIAPHHFPHPNRFVREVHRVLKLGGIFLLEDSIAPENRALSLALNELETLRDPTHVLSLTERAWLEMLRTAGFTVEQRAIDRKRHDLVLWMDRSRTPENRRIQIQELLSNLGQQGRDAFMLEFNGSGTCVAFTDEKLLVRARKVS